MGDGHDMSGPARSVQARWLGVLMCAVLVFVVSSGVTGIGLIGSIGSKAAAAGVPFACVTPTVFDAAGTPNTQLFAQTHSTTGSTFTAVGQPWSGGTYNAIAFDTSTNLIYAIANSSRSLLSIDSTGAVTTLGAVTGLPLTGNYLVGAMDPSNSYYVEDTSTGAIYVVNVSTLVATLVVTNPAVGMFDFTYANGVLWGLAESNGGVMTMVRIDPVSKVVNTFSVAGLNLPSEFYGAAWTFGNGNLGFDGNRGGVYQIAVTNPTSATPTFSVVATGPGPASTNNDGTSCAPGPVDLGIAKTGPAVVAPSGTVTWTLAVTNHGPNVSSGFVLSDGVPAGYTALSSATPGCTVTGGSVSCLGGVLAVGATATVTLTAKAPAVGGCLTNTANVLGNEADPSSADNTSSLQTCVQANPAIDLAKTASPTTVTAAGQQVSYTFVVTNTGTSALSDVSVSDVFTSGGTGIMSAITCQSLTNPPAGCSGTTTSLQIGQSATFTSTYTVTQADIDNGHVDNTAAAVGTPPTGPDVTSASTASVTAIAFPKLALQKTVAETALALGETLHYSFLVTNTGNVTLRHVRVVDGMTGLSAISCPTDILAPAASETCTATYTVTQADIDAGALSNTAVSVARSPQATQVTSDPSKATVDVASGLAASALAFTGVPAVQLGLFGLVVLLLGVLLLAARRRLACDE